MKRGIDVAGGNEIASVPHAVICNPQTMDQPLQGGEGAVSLLGALLNDRVASFYDPGFVVVFDRDCLTYMVLPRVDEDRLGSTLSQNFFYGLSPRQFIDELIQVPDLSHGWFLDVLHSDAADHALDQGS
jgi:hypothetical protein